MKDALVPALLAGLALGALTSCEKHVEVITPVRAPSQATEGTAATQTYHTRGIIKQLPDPKSPTNEFMIQHEAIDTFVNGQGKVVGMNAMTMPFPELGEGISLDGYAVNDKVAFSFTVTWPGPTWVVDSIEKLAPETEMVFGRAKPPEIESPSDGAE